MSIADVRGLAGVGLMLKSGNLARFEILGPGGLRILYGDKPTDEDINEINDFINSYVEVTSGEGAEITNSVLPKEISDMSKEELQIESDKYQKFLKGDKE